MMRVITKLYSDLKEGDIILRNNSLFRVVMELQDIKVIVPEPHTEASTGLIMWSLFSPERNLKLTVITERS